MINGAQLHLAVNHLPVVGALIAFLVLLVGTVLKNEVVKKTGLAILVFAAITVAPAYLSGEEAEELVEDKPGVSEALIHDHEESAELSLVFTALSGGVAALALFLGRKRNGELAKKTTVGALGLSAVTVVLLANTAHLGGMIRHDEIRPAGGAIPATGSGEGKVEGQSGHQSGESEDHDD
jgi:uncharacterized membrane protein